MEWYEDGFGLAVLGVSIFLTISCTVLYIFSVWWYDMKYEYFYEAYNRGFIHGFLLAITGVIIVLLLEINL